MLKRFLSVLAILAAVPAFAAPADLPAPGRDARTAIGAGDQYYLRDNGEIWKGHDGAWTLAFTIGPSSSVPGGSSGQLQGNNASLFAGIPGSFVNFITGAITTKILNAQYYASAFADSGTGAAGSCWATSGSNPVAAALAACPATGCDVILSDGCYTMGAADPAVTIPKTTSIADQRVYRFLGGGGDKAILNYSGTGTVFRYWQDNTGTPGSSIQSNVNELRGFAIRQTGTTRTGTGVWVNYGSKWIFADLSIGSQLSDRPFGDHHGFDYGLRFAERSGGYGTVDDFMTIDHCYFSGNNHAVYSGQHGDVMKVVKSHFDGNPSVLATTTGLELVGLTDGLLVAGNNFNFFGFNAASAAVKLTGAVKSAAITGNHFEGNGTAILLNSTTNQGGFDIGGNYFSIPNLSGARGVDAGIDGLNEIRGLNVHGNRIEGIVTGTQGITLHGEVKSASLDGNTYVTAGAQTPLNVGPGVSATIVESYDNAGVGNANSGSTSEPQFKVVHPVPDYIGMTMVNTNAIGNSPWFQWVAGGSHLSMSAYVDSSGALHFYNGTDRMTLSAAGAATAATFVGALTGNATTASALATPTALSAFGTLGGCSLGQSIRRDTVTGTTNECFLPATGGGEANTTADVGGGSVSLRGTTAKSGVALNLRTLSSQFTQSADVISIGTLNQNTSGSAASFTGSLVGDVGGTQGATAIGTGKVTSTHIVDGTILNADINGSAAIDGSKLVPASASVAGAVSIAAQTFAGLKTFQDGIVTSGTGNLGINEVTADPTTPSAGLDNWYAKDATSGKGKPYVQNATNGVMQVFTNLTYTLAAGSNQLPACGAGTDKLIFVVSDSQSLGDCTSAGGGTTRFTLCRCRSGSGYQAAGLGPIFGADPVADGQIMIYDTGVGSLMPQIISGEATVSQFGDFRLTPGTPLGHADANVLVRNETMATPSRYDEAEIDGDITASYDGTSLTLAVNPGFARETGSNFHGVVLWGVATATDSGWDTGDEVCGAQGFTCVSTGNGVSLITGLPIVASCSTAHTFDYWTAFCK